jgi:protocatechuate 3,4-dioxygenase beta subunit
MSTSPITRREAVKAVGAVTAAYLAAPTLAGLVGDTPTAIAATSCARLTPELTEGPYWVNTMLHRSNIRANSNGTSHQSGVPLNLYINVVDSSRDCKPLNGVAVDIWHANAHGIYSDESSQASGGGDTTSAENTITDNFLRGYQITGKDKGLARKPIDGQASFQTIWPGWYTSRAIHIHVRVRKLHSSGLPATRPRSSSRTPTTTTSSTAPPPTTPATPKTTPPPTKTTASSPKPTSPPTSSTFAAASPRATRHLQRRPRQFRSRRHRQPQPPKHRHRRRQRTRRHTARCLSSILRPAHPKIHRTGRSHLPEPHAARNQRRRAADRFPRQRGSSRVSGSPRTGRPRHRCLSRGAARQF